MYDQVLNRLKMAADDEDDESVSPAIDEKKVCKCCKKKAKNGPTCIRCCVTFHPKCAERTKKCCELELVSEEASERELIACGLSKDTFNMLKMLLSEVRNRNRLLQEKVTTLEEAVSSKDEQLKQALATIKDLEQQKIRNSSHLGSNLVSYSSAVKNTVIPTPKSSTAQSADIVLKPVQPGAKMEDVVNEVRTKINPSVLGVRINSTRAVKNSVIIKCADNEDRDKLIDAMKASLGATCSIEKPRKWNPRLIIRNVENTLLHKSDEDLIKEIVKHNNLESDTNIKIIGRLKRKFTFDIIVETTSETRLRLLRLSSIYLKWQACGCEDHIYVKQCLKCNLFGHSSKACQKEDIVCSNCNGGHKAADCTSNIKSCVNCVEMNRKRRIQVSVNHGSRDIQQCHAYQQQIQFLRAKIDY